MAGGEPEKKLTNRERAFVEHYLTGRARWNGAAAARAAGYSTKTAKEQASRLLTKVNVQAAIEARLAELKMGADQVLVLLSEQAGGSLEDFLRIERVSYHPRQAVPCPTPEDPKAVEWVEDPLPVERLIVALDWEQARDRGKLHLLKEVKWNQWGEPEIKAYSSQAALALLAKHHGLLVERHEHTGKDGAPIEIADARDRLLNKLTRRAADAETGGID